MSRRNESGPTTVSTSTNTTLPTGTWQLDPAQTKVTVTVKKMGFITVPATLDVTSGSVEINEDHQVVKVDVVADAASYTSGSAKRNEHVVNEDFLDAANHPTIAFSATSVTSKDTNYGASGSVTIKGKTSAIHFAIADVSISGDQASFAGSAVVDRNAIGVDKMPSFVIAKKLEITIDAKAARVA